MKITKQLKAVKEYGAQHDSESTIEYFTVHLEDRVIEAPDTIGFCELQDYITVMQEILKDLKEQGHV